jgi:hypothetical protein
MTETQRSPGSMLDLTLPGVDDTRIPRLTHSSRPLVSPNQASANSNPTPSLRRISAVIRQTSISRPAQYFAFPYFSVTQFCNISLFDIHRLILILRFQLAQTLKGYDYQFAQSHIQYQGGHDPGLRFEDLFCCEVFSYDESLTLSMF